MDSESIRQRLVRVALGREDADLVVRGARVVDVLTREVYEADVAVASSRIAAVGTGYQGARTVEARGAYLAPGFIDAHIHIESSSLTPARFAEAALPHGTTAVIAEPHEVANVLGLAGVRWMLEAGAASGLRVYASVPSCVPASPFERGGAVMGAADVSAALAWPGALGLAEMMNYPGVLNADPGVWAMLGAARSAHGPRARLDGHASGLSGRDVQAYAAAGLHSDHEAITLQDGLERLRAGLWLMVREGSVSRNLGALLPLLRRRPRRAMLVCDDLSVDELVELGHLDRLLRRCVAGGLDPLDALALVTCNPAEYWGLHDHGAVAPGQHADFVLLRDLERFEVLETFVGGVEARGGGVTPPLTGGGVDLGPGWASARFEVPDHWPVIGVQADQVVTQTLPPGSGDTRLVAVDRFGRHQHATAWTHGLNLRRGALALSVLHDAHHVIVAGATDDDIRAAGRAVQDLGGGAVVVENGQVLASLPLPYAGLMGDLPPTEAAARSLAVSDAARALGCPLPYPITTLSFLGLTVIPELKLTPQGLFDVRSFSMVQ